MKKIKILIVLFTILSYNLTNAQYWTYKSGGNAFDGKYRTSSIIGKGTEFPYNRPLLVINVFNNETINLYIDDAGYFQDSKDVEVLLNFNNEPDTLYKLENNTLSKDGKTIFFGSFINTTNNKEILRLALLEKLKKGSKLNVRIEDSYGINDLEFSLRGSSKAIEFVLTDSFKEKLKKAEEGYYKELDRVKNGEIAIKKLMSKYLEKYNLVHNEELSIFREIMLDFRVNKFLIEDVKTINITNDGYFNYLKLIDKTEGVVTQIYLSSSAYPKLTGKLKQINIEKTKEKLISLIKIYGFSQELAVDIVDEITDYHLEEISKDDFDKVDFEIKEYSIIYFKVYEGNEEIKDIMIYKESLMKRIKETIESTKDK